MRRLLCSFALRAALWIAGAALVLSLLGSSWDRLQVERALRKQLDLALESKTEALIRDYQSLGEKVLLASGAISERRNGPLRVFVQTADGRALAGRLSEVPAGLHGLTTLHPPGEGPLRALGTVLPGGINVVVAAPVAPIDDAVRAFARTPIITALGVALLALLLGFVGARALERRLASVSDTAGQITAGDLSRRLPQSGRGDEFDRLVGTVNLMLARLEQLMAAQRQVTDDIAHDLRSPLQHLRQRLEEALGSAGSQATTATLTAAIGELDDVLETFAALLRIARAEAGTAARQRLDLSSLVTTVAEAYCPVAEEAGRPFAIDVTPDLQIQGDPPLLQRMLANLLDNALIHGVGAICVALAPGPVLTVTDDGPGIATAEREAVLRRFVRLDRSRATPGTGLGLALVAAAIQAHRGTIMLLPARPDGGGLMVRLDLSAAGF
jgi:signal transduction histidine kinase